MGFVSHFVREMFLRTKKHVTYNDEKRQNGIKKIEKLKNLYLEQLKNNDGRASEITHFLCDTLADEYFEFALWVRGVYEFDKKRTLSRDENGNKVKTICSKFDPKCASISVKDLLEEGYDTKVLYFPVYKNDDLDEYARLLYRKGIREGVTLMPYFCDEDSRPEDEKQVDFVFLDVENERYKFSSLGEIAVLRSYDTTEDVIAMLFRANADFSYVGGKNEKPIHAFCQLMRDDTFAEEGYKDKMIDIFEKVYLNGDNQLSEKQRNRVLKAMCDCVNPRIEISNDICEDTKNKISKSLSRMFGIEKIEKEKV